MKDRSDNSSHHERTLLPWSYISLATPVWFMAVRISLCLFSDKHTFIQSLCEKLLNKDEVTAGFHTYRRLFATSKESDCSDEPAVKKPRHEDDEDNHGSIPASPTFRISCKISGRFKGSIHTQVSLYGLRM